MLCDKPLHHPHSDPSLSLFNMDTCHMRVCGPDHCKYSYQFFIDYFINCDITTRTQEAREMVRLVPVLRQGWWAISHACLLHSGLGLPGMDAMLFFFTSEYFWGHVIKSFPAQCANEHILQSDWSRAHHMIFSCALIGYWPYKPPLLLLRPRGKFLMKS